ncbi:unnamed protein product [Caenorhabditis angaria]|uniref:Regulatory protein zeste n=1 Tax=Caenorhabditis angaria TaxID=860376 RepID=A0A9P1MXU8_9PELO|nr:unnamed protein product [Caenorhabditis angaria]
MDADAFLSLVKTEVNVEAAQHQNSTESTSDDTINSIDWNETENGEKVAKYRMFFDTREKKLQEKIEFVKIVYRFKNQLFGDCDGHEVTPRSKEDAWKKVAAEVEQYGLESYKGKPWARLRDHDWQYVRRHALSRHENTNRPMGKLGELDRIVLEIISTTALANAVNQANNSQLFISQNSQQNVSVESNNSVEQYLKTFLGAVNQDSAETPELNASFEIKDQNVVQAEPSSNLLVEMLHKVGVPQCLSVDAAANFAAARKSPIPNSASAASGAKPKMTSRSQTAPSVVLFNTPPPINNSPPGPSASQGPPPHKKARIWPEKELDFEQKREILILKKMEVEIRHFELENEKLEREIRILESQEKRAAELHQIEMRAAKAKLQRGSAIDEGNL